MRQNHEKFNNYDAARAVTFFNSHKSDCRHHGLIPESLVLVVPAL